MAYVYEVAFDISPEHMDELAIGHGIERVLAMLKALLPGEEGFITARAMHSVDPEHPKEHVAVVIQSLWDYWEDLQRHRESTLAEDKVLMEFEHLSKEDLDIAVYQEVD